MTAFAKISGGQQRCRLPFSGQLGFSLIEIIIALIIASFFGTVFIQYMGSSLAKSSEPIVEVQQALALNQVMENMTSDYKRLLVENSSPLAVFKSRVENGNDPANDPYYGAYTASTGYIVFSSGAEAADTAGTNRVLKVTISAAGQSLTALFTR